MRTEEIFLLEEMATKSLGHGKSYQAEQIMDLLWFYLFDES